ncbi:MAG: ATP-binding cassette domain-containing protein [Saccharofermentans sp.]|nr:ATP-binding cassette domain-containing protein [Saccharofermentans sp.]
MAASIFEQQLRERRRRDEQALKRSMIDVADSLAGKSHYHLDERPQEKMRLELEKICAYFRVSIPKDIPETEEIEALIEYVTGPSGVMHRRVQIEGDWYRNGDGPLLAVTKEDGRLVALIPNTVSGYHYTDETGAKVKVTKSKAALFESKAVCFYRPLPQEPMEGKDLIKFLLGSIPKSDYLLIFAATILVALIGLIIPFATQIIFSQIIPTGTLLLVGSISILLVSAAIASYLMSVVRTGLLDRIRQKMDILLENAVMGRIIHLSPKFFQGKSSGGLSQSLVSLRSLPTVITDAVLGPLLTAALSIVYIIQIAMIAPSLALPAFLIFLLQAVIIYFSMKQKMQLVQKELEADIETQGIVYPAITGIQRIRLSGSEKRMTARWAQAYKNKSGAAFRIVFPSTIQNEIVTAVTLLGTLWVYYAGARSNIEVSQFAAFLSAFGVATANLLTFSQSGQILAYLKPILDMIAPVLEAVPEISTGKRFAGKMRGGIEINHVSFRYFEGQPLVLDDLTLSVKPGEYVAIVGKSGCGKSTLMRLLMGFEKPEIGTVSYDNIDIEEIDPISLRKNIGSVLQSGQLFAGDIFSNITISAPGLTLKQAWEAAEMAGVAETIKQMPMGMNTLISEGSGGISGGQKQRLLIARAIAPKPKILMFDEATSALDNITQKQISDALESLKCTRIVVAHRLSTIKNCDRIIVIDGGKIIEDGTYDSLIEKNGVFADLVARQRI